MHTNFEWNEDKNRKNKKKHGVVFTEAQYAFLFRKRVINKKKKQTNHTNNYTIYYS